MNKKFPGSAAADLALIAAFWALFSAAFSVALASGQTGPVQAETSKPKMAEEVYKNIEVFKGIPADRLIPAMQFITSGLGVECSSAMWKEHSRRTIRSRSKQRGR